jgi:hypothetical protein
MIPAVHPSSKWRSGLRARTPFLLQIHTDPRERKKHMPKHPWIEIPLIGLATIGPLLVLFARLFVKQKTTDGSSIKEAPKGIGSRMIQLIAVLLIVPIVVILALEGSVSPELTGTLLGSIVGYTLGSLNTDIAS